MQSSRSDCADGPLLVEFCHYGLEFGLHGLGERRYPLFIDHAQDRLGVHEAHMHTAGLVLTQVDARKHASYGYSDSGYYYGSYSRYYTR